MKILLRSCIAVKDNDRKDNLITNFKSLKDWLESGFKFKDIEDQNLWQFIDKFVSDNGHVPTIISVKSNFTDPITLARLDVIQMQPVQDPGDFRSILAGKTETQKIDYWKEVEKTAAYITTSGMDLPDGKGGTTLWKGVEASAKYLAKMKREAPGKSKKSKPTVSGDPDWPLASKLKSGAIIPNKGRVENTKAMMDHHGITVRFNVMSNEREITVPELKTCASREANGAYAHVRELGRKYDLGLAKEVLDEHLDLIQTPYHPAAEWLESLPEFDGIDRLMHVFRTLTTSPEQDSQLAYDLLLTWMVSAVKAAKVPLTSKTGHASQGILVLVGKGDIQKSRWLEHLVPNKDWFKGGMILRTEKTDSIMAATASWIVELGELDATFARSDQSAMKAFITEDKDRYRAPYDHCVETHARRSVYCGSVNDVRFLRDETGSRKYWPIEVDACDVEALMEMDIKQIWAQVLFAERNGVTHWLDDSTKKSLAKEQARFENRSPLIDRLQAVWKPDWSMKSKVGNDEIRDAIRPDKWTRAETCEVLAFIRRRWDLKPTTIQGLDYWPLLRTTADANKPIFGMDDNVFELIQ